MNMGTTNAVKTYASVNVESGVNGADPHRLILMLYEGALAALARARAYMERKDTAEKNKAITKAVAIINEGLRASLDVKAGGEIAQNLDALYEYMGRRLLLANLKNQPEILDEVSRLLAEIKGAWEEIGKHQRPAMPAVSEAATGMRPPVSYGKA
jgi:flagellar protein FliS